MKRAFVLACALMTGLAAQDSAALQGVVRNAAGAIVPTATVQLTIGGRTLTSTTDARGAYRFRALPAGTCTLRAGEASFGPFTLSRGESKTVDLTIRPSAKPEFFDQPSFIVAGVTDPALRGGHGSDPVLRSAESLTKDTASLRKDSANPLADEQERTGDALDAVREYQRAAELDASEANLFNWGVELLKHHAPAQAAEIFAKGNRLYPQSTRMLLGVAVALYSRGSYDEAAQRFFEAADLNPADPVPYLFLGRLPEGAITNSAGYRERLSRFARLHPDNAQANYYYAACLRRQAMGDAQALRTLLEKAVRLDPHLAAAWLLLGVVCAEQNQFPQAIAAYQNAISADPDSAEPHYRLAQAWQKTGQTSRARAEIAVYRKLAQDAAVKAERERTAIQEFVFSLRR